MSILKYIKRNWPLMVRTHENLAQAAADPKTPESKGPWPVYVADDENAGAVAQCLRATIKSANFDQIRILPIPATFDRNHPHGLLYLPRPYVVPGGRFNEMYGWDSYFIQMGLLRDGHEGLAKDLADNFIYEIRHYGKILNANRTYYLGRSQPPFLTQMLLAVFRRTHDAAWLESSLDALDKYYRYWVSEPHLTPETGLSRYIDLGSGPAPEVLSSELDADGRTDYQLIRQYFRTHEIPDYDASLFYDAANDRLTPLFYKGDRSMRESGFDPSNRFGPFSVDILHYNPVCLNSLLYLMEMETAEIKEALGLGEEAKASRTRAAARAVRMNQFLWDEEQGLYFDYHFVKGNRRPYPFLSTFYPLWAGIAKPQQAARVAGNLPLFECQGGLQTSTHQSGDQWDAPIGWAPLIWIAVQGLQRYGYDAEADRIAWKFLGLVHQEFQAHGTIEEKYDVVRCRANISNEILFGYRSNEAGFGWTNAVFTALFDELSRKGACPPTGNWAAPRSSGT
jgi:alpha,alpha-trehalase